MMKSILTVALVLCGIGSALADEQYYSMDDFYRVPKADVHMHIHSTNPAFMQEAIQDQFRVLSINVDYSDFPPLEVQQSVAEQLLKTYPANFAFAATFSVTGFGQPGWQQGVIAHLDEAIAQGAIAVKVWKNIGMELRDKDGSMVMIDDPRFGPIFDHLEQKHIPLLGHQGEPKNCWLPIAQMTGKNDAEYFTRHPQYYMFLHPELPSYEDQIRARDAMLSQHPKLQFVGLHLASIEWSVSELANFLERYPHVMVDLAARVGNLQSQSILDRDRVRNFLIRYQDRIMYGSDLDQEPEPVKPCTSDCGVPFAEQARGVWLRDWRYFTSADMIGVPDLDQPVQGLHLPQAVIDKIFGQNVARAFPAAWAGQAAH